MTEPRQSVRAVAGMDAVGPAEWSALSVGCSLYSGPDWIRHADRMTDSVPDHLILERDGRPVAALPGYRFPGARPFFYDLGPVLGLGKPAEADDVPLHLAGTRLGYTGDVLTRALCAPAERESAARALYAAFAERCRESGARGAMLYVTDESLAQLLPALGPSDRVVLVDAAARLAVPADGLDGYRRLFSRGRWDSFRREMRRFRDEGCETRVLALGENLPEMGALASQVSRRYGHDMSPEDETLKLREQAERLGECVMLTAFRGEEMVGFTQFFLRDGTMYGRGHGVADAYGRRASIYFNLTYYEAVRWGAEHGLTHIDLGCDSLEAKVVRGGRLRPLWAVVAAPEWSAAEQATVREQERQRLRQYRGLDPEVVTPVVRAVAAREGWDAEEEADR
ncbi:GNAT family N-acetyltransferase [Streptomyces sp. NPDC091267]|uniref:GNAT family N-acetyltransferase n=1 Tax=unclassified Streptomyces TaxID=2593676 RepID=UPI00343A98E7